MKSLFFNIKNILNAHFIGTAIILVPSIAFSESLEEVIQESFFTNPVILSSKAGVEIAKNINGDAFSNYLPTVTASAGITNKKTSFSTSTTSSHPKIYKLAVNQTLFNGGSIVAENRSAQIGVKEAVARLDTTMQQQILACVTAYMDILQAREVSNLNENLVKVLTQQKNATEIQFKHGEVTKTDVQQARARLAEARAQAVQAKTQIIKTNQSLKALLGRVPTKVKWPKIPKEYKPVDQATLDKVASNHPDVVASLMDLSQKKHDITKEKAAYYPTITATAELSRNEGILSGSTTTDYTDRVLGLNLSMDIFQGGATVSAVSEAMALKKQAEQAYELARRSVKEELINAEQGLSESFAVLDAFTESMEAEKLATEGVKREATLGERSILDILDAEQSYLQSQVNVTQARKNTIISYYRFKAAVGELASLF